MSRYQQTIARPIEISGIGLHSGKRVTMKLLPAPPCSGIHFLSTHQEKAIRVRASADYITKTTLSTTLGIPDSAQIHTVEHILSALYGLGIDNLTIQLNDIEIPIMDGSALPFVKLIAGSGVVKQHGRKRYLRILKKIEVIEDGKSIAILPDPETRITYSIDFNHPLISRQEYSLLLGRTSFVREIAPARTFGFLNEFSDLQKKGLIKGGSLENAVVIDQDKILNEEGLRYSDEFVRHKILDLIGDISLLGYPVQGHIVAHRAGHSLHAKLVAKILKEKDSWILTEASPRRVPAKTSRAYPALVSR